MALGPFNAGSGGSGGSSTTIDELIAQLMSGKIATQLATADGETICTTDGVEIKAVKYL